MKYEFIFGFVIYLFVAAVMLGIGISQYRSKKPVGFYSGEKPPLEHELTDVIMWNKKHAIFVFRKIKSMEHLVHFRKIFIVIYYTGYQIYAVIAKLECKIYFM